LSMRYEPSPGA